MQDGNPPDLNAGRQILMYINMTARFFDRNLVFCCCQSQLENAGGIWKEKWLFALLRGCSIEGCHDLWQFD
jgi:hypothetical protein